MPVPLSVLCVLFFYVLRDLSRSAPWHITTYLYSSRVCACVCDNVRMHVFVYVCACLSMCVCVYVCVCGVCCLLVFFFENTDSFK